MHLFLLLAIFLPMQYGFEIKERFSYCVPRTTPIDLANDACSALGAGEEISHLECESAHNELKQQLQFNNQFFKISLSSGDFYLYSLEGETFPVDCQMVRKINVLEAVSICTKDIAVNVTESEKSILELDSPTIYLTQLGILRTQSQEIECNDDAQVFSSQNFEIVKIGRQIKCISKPKSEVTPANFLDTFHLYPNSSFLSQLQKLLSSKIWKLFLNGLLLVFLIFMVFVIVLFTKNKLYNLQALAKFMQEKNADNALDLFSKINGPKLVSKELVKCAAPSSPLPPSQKIKTEDVTVVRVEKEAAKEFICVCGKKCLSNAGLTSHKKSCEDCKDTKAKEALPLPVSTFRVATRGSK